MTVRPEVLTTSDGPLSTCFLVKGLWTGGSLHVDLTMMIVVAVVVGVALCIKCIKNRRSL